MRAALYMGALVATRCNPAGRKGILREAIGRRQAEEGGASGLHAQAAGYPQRYSQEPRSLESVSRPGPLTSKTVLFMPPKSFEVKLWLKQPFVILVQTL